MADWMPNSETSSPDSGGFCCCFGGEKKEEQPVQLVKREPITSQPSPNSQEERGIVTQTAKETIDGYEEVNLELKTIEKSVMKTASANGNGFNITDLMVDELCTKEESDDEREGDCVLEDEPVIESNVIEAIDEAELTATLQRIKDDREREDADTPRKFPSVMKESEGNGEGAEKEEGEGEQIVTFKQLMAEDYERRKTELLSQMEEESVGSSGESDNEETREKGEEEDAEKKREEEEREKKRQEEKAKMQREMLEEIESLNLEEITVDEDTEKKWEERQRLSERELKKAEESERGLMQESTGREEDTDSETEEVMVDHAHRLPTNGMYSQMDESSDEDSDDEMEREVIVPPPRTKHTVENGNEKRPDSGSEKENDNVTRVSLKSNGVSTVLSDSHIGSPVRVTLDPHIDVVTDDEFSEKLI